MSTEFTPAQLRYLDLNYRQPPPRINGAKTFAGALTLENLASVGLVHTSAAGLLTTSLLAVGDVTPGTANQVLTTNGAGTAAAWAKLLDANVDDSAAISRAKLAVGSATYAVLLNNGTDKKMTELASGADSTVLAGTGANGLPAFQQIDSTAFFEATVAAFLCPVGSVLMYGAAAAPSGWVLCDGASLLRAGTYAALFAVIGTTYGTADGTHFSLPDFRGIFPKGAGTTDRASGKDANGNYYAETLGTYRTDQAQGHRHQAYDYTNDFLFTGGGLGARFTAGTGNNTSYSSDIVREEIANGTNGTPRTGTTTEPQSLGISFIIKY